MSWIASVLPTLEHSRFVRLVRRVGLGPWRVLPWLVLAVVLEVLGRTSPSDLVDGLGVLLLVSAVWLNAARHRARLQTWWTTGSGRRLAAEVRRWRIEAGVDLRGGPPVETGLPRRWVALWLVLVSATCGLVATASWWPSEARLAIRSVSGLAWLAFLGVAWGVFLAGGVMAWFLTYFAFWSASHASRSASGPAPGPSRSAFPGAVTMAVLAVAIVCGIFVPERVAIAVLASLMGLYACAIFPLLRRPRILWRSPGGAMRWASLGHSEVGFTLGIGCALIAFALVGFGDRTGIGVDVEFGGSAETTVTAFLARVFFWSMSFFYVGFLSVIGSGYVRARIADPARPVPVRLRPAGVLAAREQQAFRRAARDAGFAASFEPRAIRATDVVVRFVPDSPSEPGGEPMSGAWSDDVYPPHGWPRPLASRQLADPAVCAALRRRGDLLRRRHLRRTLERLLRQLARQGKGEDNGVWLAPHLWFATRLGRESEGDPFERKLPPYRRVLDLAARRHLFEVLAALDVDLIFLEDGVSFAQLRRVWSLLFEFYDLFGARPLEERHFAGVHGVRVLIHETTLERPFRSSTYPEPDYEEIGRARVLHVFRDRGEEEEAYDDPSPSGSAQPVRPSLEPVLA